MGSRDHTKTREFENQITNIATEIPNLEGTKEYYKILEKSEEEEEKRLKAYYILFTYFRRQRDTHKCFEIYNKYKKCLSLEKDFLARQLYSIALKGPGEGQNLDKSIEMTQSLLKEFPEHAKNHPGVLHNLAGALCAKAEIDGTDANLNDLNDALDMVEEAIDKERYAKFYSTKAQILSGLGKYKEALYEINRAIDKEDSTSADYAIRLAEYQSIKVSIEFRKVWADSQSYLEEKTKKASDKARKLIDNAIEEGRRSNLQILGLFIAVIGFTLGGIQISISFDSASDAIQVLIFLGAILLAVVSGFTLLYPSKGKIGGYWWTFIVSIVLIVFGLFWPRIEVKVLSLWDTHFARPPANGYVNTTRNDRMTAWDEYSPAMFRRQVENAENSSFELSH